MQNSHLNAFTGSELLSWPEICSSFFSPGTLSFTKKTDSGTSFSIRGLMYEFSPLFINLEDRLILAMCDYEEAAKKRNPIACLRLSQIFATQKNEFKIECDLEKAIIYAAFAVINSITLPYFQEESKNNLMDYIEWMKGDSLGFKKIVEILNNIYEGEFIKHKAFIMEVLPIYSQEKISKEEKRIFFEGILKKYDYLIDENNIGIFLNALYSGDFEKDTKFYSRIEICDYFNTVVKEIFSLYQSNFNPEGLIKSDQILIFSTNVWHYLLWRGKKYSGEIDDCLQEMVRMIHTLLKMERNSKIVFSDEERIGYHFFLIYFHRKGIFLKRDYQRSLNLFAHLEGIVLPYNLSYELGKLYDKQGMKDEAEQVFQIAYEAAITGLESNKDEFMPFDFYLLGFLEMRLNNNTEKAKFYFDKSIEKKEDCMERPFEFLAFQRKSRAKLKKLENEPMSLI